VSRPDDRYKLSSWRGEFLNFATESAFRKHSEPSMARHLRKALKVWAVLVLLFGVLDLMALGWSEPFFHMMAGRAISALLILGLAWRLKSRPELASEGYAVTAVEVIGFVFFFLIYFVRPDITSWNVGVTLIVIVSLYVFIPNRVVLSNIVALFGIVGTTYCLALKGAAPTLLVGLFFVLSLPTIVGYIAGLRLQLVQREQFMLLSEMKEVNQTLEQEILRREKLEIELKHQATTDPLTGLFNRRQYEIFFEKERDRSVRHGGKLSLCVLDLDHFKQINDLHGHDLGDQALKHVARLFSNTLRQADIIGRFGGEEFIILLPETDLEQAVVVVDRLRQCLEESPLLAGGLIVKITATFGLTEVGEGDELIEDVIRRADKALYDGKLAGRNRVVTANL